MSQRMLKVRELMRRELGTILTRDFEVAKDSLLTVTDVDVTPDLREAFVYVSVIGAAKPDRVLEKLSSKRGAIQRALYSRVTLRYSPSLTFRIDDSLERGNEVIDLIAEVDKLPTADPAQEGDPDFEDGDARDESSP